MKIKLTNSQIAVLKQIVKDFHWMARRYADGRSSYTTGLFNANTRELLKMGIALNPTTDETIWAKDGSGRQYDGLTEKEAEPGTDEAMGLK